MQPKNREVTLNLFESFKNFRNNVRWKFYWRQAKNDISLENNEIESIKDQESVTAMTNLKLKANSAPVSDIATEEYLNYIYKNIIYMARKILNSEEPKSYESRKIKAIIDQGYNEQKVVIPTDKTGKYVSLKLDEYKKLMKDSLKKIAVLVKDDHKFLNKRSKILIDEIDKLRDEEIISHKEYKFIEKSIRLKEVGKISVKLVNLQFHQQILNLCIQVSLFK